MSLKDAGTVEEMTEEVIAHFPMGTYFDFLLMCKDMDYQSAFRFVVSEVIALLAGIEDDQQ